MKIRSAKGGDGTELLELQRICRFKALLSSKVEFFASLGIKYVRMQKERVSLTRKTETVLRPSKILRLEGTKSERAKVLLPRTSRGRKFKTFRRTSMIDDSLRYYS